MIEHLAIGLKATGPRLWTEISETMSENKYFLTLKIIYLM
jgi:hypothetical protein